MAGVPAREDAWNHLRLWRLSGRRRWVGLLKLARGADVPGEQGCFLLKPVG